MSLVRDVCRGPQSSLVSVSRVVSLKPQSHADNLKCVSSGDDDDLCAAARFTNPMKDGLESGVKL